MHPENAALVRGMLAVQRAQLLSREERLEPWLEEDEAELFKAHAEAVIRWYDAPADDLTPDGKGRILTPASAVQMLSEQLVVVEITEKAWRRVPRSEKVEAVAVELAAAREELREAIENLRAGW